MSKKNILTSFFFIVSAIAISAGVSAENNKDLEARKNEAIKNAEAMKAEIIKECGADPVACSCQRIPCDDIMQSNDPRTKELHQRCVAERNACEKNRQSAIKKMSEQKEQISSRCKKNSKNCDCSEVENEDGKKQCELAVIEAKYQAELERNEKIKFCRANIDKCDCGSIENEQGREECRDKLSLAKAQRAKIEFSCRENPLVCDCSSIESEEGRTECESKKAEGLKEADSAVKAALSKCFKDVDRCKCDALNLENKEYVEFCDTQKNYGLNCKYEGFDCEKLENAEIYPPGMPPWLGKIFAKSYKSFIENEKQKGVKEAAGLITVCLNSPDKCDCEKAPTYARAHCERAKALQIKCLADDYDACIILDKSPNLPEGVPEFSYSFLDNLINALRNARSSLIKANAARKVGNMILECMDGASKCDCSLAPSGSIKTFCEHKKKLVEMCWNKHYDSCFALDEEPVLPEETPNFIRAYAERSVLPQLERKKREMFDELKRGTVCAETETIKECKKVLKAP